MFTGLVEAVGVVLSVRTVGDGRSLAIDAGDVAADAKLGDSIAVNGVCLTVCGIDGRHLDFDVVAETVRRSNLGGLRVGDRVNLEGSLRVGDRVGGHFVQGHIDGTARIVHKACRPHEWAIGFQPDPTLLPYIVPKGAIAVDGVSLTVADASEGRFWVALVPTTLAATTLGQKAVGDSVNIETDVLVRAVIHWLRSSQAGVTEPSLTVEKLQEFGFA